MTACIFCDIVAGKIPSEKVFEDKDTLAFMDIRPVNKGHVLVIPKKHFEQVFDIPQNELEHVARTGKKVSHALKESGLAQGVNLVNSSGKPANQEVFHFHLHVLPRFSGDDTGFRFNHQEYSEGEMKAFAERIAREIPK